MDFFVFDLLVFNFNVEVFIIIIILVELELGFVGFGFSEVLFCILVDKGYSEFFFI